MDRELPHQVTVSPALRNRAFAIDRVWVDQDGTHVAYRVDADASLQWQFPDMEGQDDLGNDYPSRGGAMSPATDGRHDGTLSVEAPAEGARQLKLDIAWDEGEGGQSASVAAEVTQD